MNKIVTIALIIGLTGIFSNVFAGDQHNVSGVVKKVITDKKQISISHGPIKALGMDGMTMSFAVYDPSMLDDVKVGNKVDFVIEVSKSGSFTIVEIEDKGKATGTMSAGSGDGHNHSH